jgi:hypothetical protein
LLKPLPFDLEARAHLTFVSWIDLFAGNLSPIDDESVTLHLNQPRSVVGDKPKPGRIRLQHPHGNNRRLKQTLTKSFNLRWQRRVGLAYRIFGFNSMPINTGMAGTPAIDSRKLYRYCNLGNWRILELR